MTWIPCYILEFTLWAPLCAEPHLFATVLHSGCIVAYNSLTPAQSAAEFWRQVVSCVRLCGVPLQQMCVRVCVCVAMVASCRQSCHHRPRVGCARLASPRHASPGIVGFLNASECFGSSFSAKHEAEHHRIPLFPLSAAPLLVGAFVVVGVSVVSVVAVVVVVVIAAPVAAKFVCCFWTLFALVTSFS